MKLKTLVKLSPLPLAIGIILFILYGLIFVPTPNVNSVDIEDPKRTSETFYVGDLICQFGDVNKDDLYYFHGFHGNYFVIAHYSSAYFRQGGMANIYYDKNQDSFRLKDIIFYIESFDWTVPSITLSWD